MIRALIFDCFGVVMDMQGVRRDEAVLAYIDALHRTYKVALLSNATGESLHRRMPEGKRFFDVIVASADVGVAKPDERIFELTAERLGVLPEECVVIDDNEGHCAGARGTGMQAVWYRDLQQLRHELEPLLAA